MREGEAQGCGDCRNNIWCLPEQVRYQLAGGRIEEFLCILEPRPAAKRQTVSVSLRVNNEQHEKENNDEERS